MILRSLGFAAGEFGDPPAKGICRLEQFLQLGRIGSGSINQFFHGIDLVLHRFGLGHQASDEEEEERQWHVEHCYFWKSNGANSCRLRRHVCHSCAVSGET